jgi:hypothetical protein
MIDGNGDFPSFAAALLDPAQPLPLGLATWNGSDAGVRFGVHRNNVVVSLVGALADTFPVTRELVGDAFFHAMGRCFVAVEPPRSPVLTEYGDAFPDFIGAFEPARSLPYLPDLARLELARVRAYHAADADALELGTFAQCLANPQRLPETRLTLHPSLAALDSAHAIVSLWAAHQGTGRIEDIDPRRPESALVLRSGDDILVLPIPAATAVFAHMLAAGAPLGEATARSTARDPGFDLAQVLALLIRCGGIAAWHPPGDLKP